MHSSSVSVCVPVYNRPELVRGAIQSALDQDYAPLDILVVDNNSTDHTWEVLQSYSDPRLRLVRNERNLGLMGNFNRCLDLARGSYVRILCSDDRLQPGTIAQECAVLKKHPNVAVVSTRCRHVDQDGYPVRTSGAILAPGIYPGRQVTWATSWCLANYADNPFNFPSGILLRRDAAARAGHFDESLHGLADVDFWLRMLEHGDACFLESVGCTVIEHTGREGFDLFWRGLYMQGQFELVRRRCSLYQEPNNRLEPMLTLLGGRCLWYVLKSALYGRQSSAAIHRRLLREYGVSTPSAAWALFELVVQRFQRRLHLHKNCIHSAMERAFCGSTAGLASNSR